MTGRIDIAFLRLAKLGCDTVEKRTGAKLWENGIERVAQAAIREWGIPTDPVDIPMTLARNVFGILPEAPRKRLKHHSSYARWSPGAGRRRPRG